jgi:hypothetical protein
MRQTAIAAVTMIAAAGLIGITQARLPRPVRDYRDRVTVEMSAIAPIETIVDWIEAAYGGPIARHQSR